MPQVFCSFQTYIKENPYAKVADITEMFVNTFQRKCSQTTTKRLLKIWKWSWKVPAYVQTHKYSISNLTYYGYYILFLKRVDLNKVKFVDESHFVPKNLRSRKVIGMKNQRVWLPISDLKEKHASITLLTTLTSDIPIFFNWRVNSNSGVDFLYFVISCIANGYLKVII